MTLIASATEDFSTVKEERATYGKEVLPGASFIGFTGTPIEKGGMSC